ncbi:MFS transporter [Nocardia brevicatena]|uniref:MFS transporter n=1 Tax=Nocardia brevicatena TaxID=37327 RepID=UPI0006861FE9|nr:MFS transporter [Nocardia brevicatena]
MLFTGTGDLIPYYALYALLFADHGLGPGQISLLLAVWSMTTFLLEVPSGAWADTVSRRGLLVLSGVLLTTGFVLWTVVPSYLGFALGFVLWGVSSALRSGTFEALLYDELTAYGSGWAYPRILGYARAATEVAALLGILAATPLYLWGGYALVGWVSVAFAAGHTALAGTLPAAPKSVSTTDVDELADAAGVPSEPRPVEPTAAPAASGSVSRYLAMLRTGVTEAVRVRVVRRGVVLAALLAGITAFDEYFALVAAEAGAATAVVPVLVGVTVLGSLLGSSLAGRTAEVGARALAVALGIGGVLFLVGAVVAGLAVRRPDAVYVFTGLGFTAIAASYGIVYNAAVLAEARLQDAIEGRARATVTSVAGLLEEVVALVVFGFVASATLWLSMASTVALLGVAILGIAVLTRSWLPRRGEPGGHAAEQLVDKIP